MNLENTKKTIDIIKDIKIKLLYLDSDNVYDVKKEIRDLINEISDVLINLD